MTNGNSSSRVMPVAGFGSYARRIFYESNTSIMFGQGMKMTDSGTGASGPGNVIPIYIYGIK